MKKSIVILLAVSCLLAVLSACKPAPDPVPPACEHPHRETVVFNLFDDITAPLYERCTDCGAITRVLSAQKDTNTYSVPASVTDADFTFDAQQRVLEFSRGVNTGLITISEDGLIETIEGQGMDLELSYDLENGRRTEISYNTAGGGKQKMFEIVTSLDGGMNYEYRLFDGSGDVMSEMRFEYTFNPEGDWTERRVYYSPDFNTPGDVLSREIEYSRDFRGNIFKAAVTQDGELFEYNYENGRLVSIFDFADTTLDRYVYDETGLLVVRNCVYARPGAPYEKVYEYTWTDVE